MVRCSLHSLALADLGIGINVDCSQSDGTSALSYIVLNNLFNNTIACSSKTFSILVGIPPGPVAFPFFANLMMQYVIPNKPCNSIIKHKKLYVPFGSISDGKNVLQDSITHSVSTRILSVS